MSTFPKVDTRCSNCGRNVEPDIAIEMDYCSACGHPIERSEEKDPGDSGRALEFGRIQTALTWSRRSGSNGKSGAGQSVRSPWLASRRCRPDTGPVLSERNERSDRTV